jgi:broad specificity phosphatase PhoE
MSVRITYFVHGTTTDNEQGLATGQAPGELSELGIRQSKELPGLIGDRRFDVVFCSDLKRAIDSAGISFGKRYRIIQDRRLRECNYGDFTRKPAKEFKSNMKEYIHKPFLNGESYKDVERRIGDFLRFLKEEYDGKSVAIVAHQAPQLALDVLLKNKTWEQAIDEYWGKTGSWQPGWEYVLE